MKMFDDNWEIDYFFIENMEGEAQCMICYSVISKKTLYKIKRHYCACHNLFEFFTGDERKVKLLELKAAFFLNS